MSVVIKGMKMPKIEGNKAIKAEIRQIDGKFELGIMTGGYFCSQEWTYYPLVEVPTPHGRLIDADKLHEATYHRAFETDGDTMWQSGCWVRYRAIEQVQDSQPTIIEAEEGE